MSNPTIRTEEELLSEIPITALQMPVPPDVMRDLVKSIPSLAVEGFYPVLPGEVGVTSRFYPYGDVRRFGAVPGGVFNNATALSNWLTAIKGEKGSVSSGRYLCQSALSLIDDASPHNYNGTLIEGEGWEYVNNGGTEIVFDGDTGPLLTLGSTAVADPTAANVTIRDLALRFTNASLAGALLRLLDLHQVSFENVRFAGIAGSAVGTLIEANQLVNLIFRRCRFEDAASGIVATAFGGFSNFINVVRFEDCFFDDLTTIADLTLACRTVYFDHCTYEPAASGAAGSILVGGHAAIFNACWAGDGNGTGTWITATGEKLTVTNSDLRSGAFAIDDDTLFGATIDSNTTLEGSAAAVKVQSTQKTRVTNNRLLAAADNAVCVDVVAGWGHVVEDNHCSESGARTGTIGYRFAAGTKGYLRDKVAGTVDTLVSDSSAGGWEKDTGADRMDGTITTNIGLLGAGVTFEISIAIPGAEVGDSVAVTAPAAIEAGLMWSGYVSATDTVKIRIHNTTGAGIDPASATWKARVFRSTV